MDNKTVFYTELFTNSITEIEGIISLNEGDVFLGKDGEHYTIVWKAYDPFQNIMIYHGNPTFEV